jgi:hypothetical protein
MLAVVGVGVMIAGAGLIGLARWRRRRETT